MNDSDENTNNDEGVLHTDSPIAGGDSDKSQGLSNKLGNLPGNALKAGADAASKAADGAKGAAGGASGSLPSIGGSGGSPGGGMSVPGVGGGSGETGIGGVAGSAGKKALDGFKQGLNPAEHGPGTGETGPQESGDKKDKDVTSELMSKEMAAAKETARVGTDIARAAVGDETALLKYKDPRQVWKSSKAVILFLGTIVGGGVLIGILIFGLLANKLQVLSKGIDDLTSQIPLAGAEIRVAQDATGFLIDTADTLWPDDINPISDTANGSVVYAQENETTIEEFEAAKPVLSPTTQKTYETWQKAGLGEMFVKEYGGKITINRNSEAYKQGELKNYSAWNLYSGSTLIGSLDSAESQAFIAKFIREKTHWKDIYNRIATRAVAKKEFGFKSGKLEFTDEGFDLEKTRQQVVKSIVKTTMQPIADKSGEYLDCLLNGASSCNDLGLGSENAPANTTQPQTQACTGQLNDSILSQYSKEIENNLAGNVQGPNNRDTVVARIVTGTSESILLGFPKSTTGRLGDVGAFSGCWFLTSEEKIAAAIDNNNLARALYDRNTSQNIMQGMNYYVGGGQIVNGDMRLMNAGVLTDNLNSIESSPVFRTAFMGGGSVYAQSNATQAVACQKVFNDTLAPLLDDQQAQQKRTVRDTICVDKNLLPKPGDYVTQTKFIERCMGTKAQCVGSVLGTAVGEAIADLNDQFVDPDDVQCSFSLPLEFLEFGCEGAKERAVSSIASVAAGIARLSKVGTDQLQINEADAPIVDGSTSQIYGTSLSGAETNGDAFDTMWATGETLWNYAVIDEENGMGAAYLDDKTAAKNLNYALKQHGTEMAYAPLSERMFSFSNSNSLASRLAMLTPSNHNTGLQKLASLMSPQSLTTPFALQLTPQTHATNSAFAASTNPMSAIRFGYPIDHPSNTMPSADLWKTYSCDTPKPQATGTPADLPFEVPVEVNPCKREKTLSIVTTCWFNDSDCKLDGSSDSNTNTGERSAGFIWPIAGNGGSAVSQCQAPGSHDGIDVFFPSTEPIVAVQDGQVVFAQTGYNGGAGNYVVIKHKDDIFTRSLHLQSFNVKVGDQVKQGDIIGIGDNTGRSTGPHLHFEVRKGGTGDLDGVVENPAKYLPDKLNLKSKCGG